MLDFDPTLRLGGDLKEILASARNPSVELRQERAGQGNLAGAILRCDPAVVFLVLNQFLLNRAAELLSELKKVSADRPLVVVAEQGEPNQIFQLLERGAADFVSSPLKAWDILPRLWRLLGIHSRQSDGVSLPSTASEALRKLIGRDQAFVQQLQRLPMVAKSDTSVLISGETGTGKELFAKAIHQMSPRAHRPFTPVNCGAIPVELVENELFGHERGAYTGANISRAGLIQEANGGTLFLDEIDALPLLAQVKLLRFLQEKEYRALGSAKTVRADVRVITATNLNIEEAVKSGKLRQDLYYRLNIIALTLPPLRERPDDIPVLANHFLGKYAVQAGKVLSGFSPGALHKLSSHAWPGNVRELEHLVERAAVLCNGNRIEVSDLSLPGESGGNTPPSFQQAKAKVVTQFERTYLQGLLLAYAGNITRAAQVAQKDRRAFFELLRKHGIDARSFRLGQIAPPE